MNLTTAEEQLKKSLFVSCAKANYVMPIIEDDSVFPVSGGKIRYAVDEPVFKPVPWVVTKADILNGVDWIGEVVLTASAVRLSSAGEWGTPKPIRHLVAEEIRNRRTDIEGTCAKCVLVEREVASFGAYHSEANGITSSQQLTPLSKM